MKKIMGMMLGLSLLMGTVTVFADAPAPTKKTKKTKKSKSTKEKKDTTSTQKKS